MGNEMRARPNIAYPLVDEHRTMNSTLCHGGSSFLTSNSSAYDAWRKVRNADAKGAPKQRWDL
jgi:hypothetical protein